MTSVTVLVSSSNLTVAKDLIILAELTPLIASGYIFIKKNRFTKFKNFEVAAGL